LGRTIANSGLPDLIFQTDTVVTDNNGTLTVAVVPALYSEYSATVSSYTQDVIAFITSFDGANLVIGTSAPNCTVMYRIVSRRVI